MATRQISSPAIPRPGGSFRVSPAAALRRNSIQSTTVNAILSADKFLVGPTDTTVLTAYCLSVFLFFFFSFFGISEELLPVVPIYERLEGGGVGQGLQNSGRYTADSHLQDGANSSRGPGAAESGGSGAELQSAVLPFRHYPARGTSAFTLSFSNSLFIN